MSAEAPKNIGAKEDEAKNQQSGPKALITRGMTLGAVVAKFPQTAPVMRQYGLHCIGCLLASLENIEQGARAHGLPDEKIDEMVEKMNEAIG